MTLMGVFLVIRARYAEERRNKLQANLQLVTGASDDVAEPNAEHKRVTVGSEDKNSLLHGEEEREGNKEGLGRDEEEQGGVMRGKKGRKGYMVVMADKEVELQEISSM